MSQIVPHEPRKVLRKGGFLFVVANSPTFHARNHKRAVVVEVREAFLEHRRNILAGALELFLAVVGPEACEKSLLHALGSAKTALVHDVEYESQPVFGGLCPPHHRVEHFRITVSLANWESTGAATFVFRLFDAGAAQQDRDIFCINFF